MKFEYIQNEWNETFMIINVHLRYVDWKLDKAFLIKPSL